MRWLMTLALVITLAASATGAELKAFQMREDYGTEPLWQCYMQYYYTIPCPTDSWFWAYTGVDPGDKIGVFFTVGDPSMHVQGCDPGYASCDPYNDHTIEQLRVLDFAGYGTIYPGLWTIEFDLYCCDASGCPVGPSLWNSGPVEFTRGWNYIDCHGMYAVTGCATDGFGYPRVLITATNVGDNGCYPAWGFDNIGSPVGLGCAMHDLGCCPALYPRPAASHYGTMHTGFYGRNFQYCPPIWFLDGADTTDGGDMTGFIELAWRIYLIRSGPDAAEPSSWGAIKSMYR